MDPVWGQQQLLACHTISMISTLSLTAFWEHPGAWPFSWSPHGFIQLNCPRDTNGRTNCSRRVCGLGVVIPCRHVTGPPFILSALPTHKFSAQRSILYAPVWGGGVSTCVTSSWWYCDNLFINSEWNYHSPKNFCHSILCDVSNL